MSAIVLACAEMAAVSTSSVSDLQPWMLTTAQPVGSPSFAEKSASAYSTRSPTHGATATAAASTALNDAGLLRSAMMTRSKLEGESRAFERLNEHHPREHVVEKSQ